MKKKTKAVPIPAKPDWAGPVALAKFVDHPDGLLEMVCERYAIADGLGSRYVLVKWAGSTDPESLHMFSRETGLCLESPRGEMRDFQIHPQDLERFSY